MIPPNKEFKKIFFGVLVILPLVIFAISIMITNQITIGDLLAVTIPILIASISYAWYRYHYGHDYFILKANPKGYLYPDYENKLRSFSDRLEIPLGESTHSLVLQAKADVTLKHIHFHFNDQRSPKGLTKKEVIEIVNLDRPLDVYPDWDSFIAPVNSIGGCDGYYQDSKTLIKDSYLYLQIRLNAHQLWAGYLVFYARRGVIGGRGHAYLAIEVKAK